MDRGLDNKRPRFDKPLLRAVAAECGCTGMDSPGSPDNIVSYTQVKQSVLAPIRWQSPLRASPSDGASQRFVDTVLCVANTQRRGSTGAQEAQREDKSNPTGAEKRTRRPNEGNRRTGGADPETPPGTRDGPRDGYHRPDAQGGNMNPIHKAVSRTRVHWKELPTMKRWLPKGKPTAPLRAGRPQ